MSQQVEQSPRAMKTDTLLPSSRSPTTPHLRTSLFEVQLVPAIDVDDSLEALPSPSTSVNDRSVSLDVKPFSTPDHSMESKSRPASPMLTPHGHQAESTKSSIPALRPASLATKKPRKIKQEQGPPQLIAHLPIALDEAQATFTELSSCTYANKTLGNIAYYDEDESASCECHWNADADPAVQACGEDSGCVNRSLQIECLEGECKCRRHCQNQRFQQKQYASIEVVKTPKKGFGVRAAESMSADTFVYEYVGEVMGPTVFARKMKEYAQEGIRHFYFMALDKDVFIDATKRGGLGRFLNHSCNPNCFVAKWTVGRKMRMGIFTKRFVEKDEELTFNYNVDRYGHTAQECYCGEPNCVGFIGGKTQTDIGGMDELYIDALGIGDEVEALGLRGTKKKKGKRLDEDFLPILRPICVDEVSKVSAAMRQAIGNRRILEKLLQRIQLSGDDEVQRQLLRLKGFVTMNHILQEYPSDAPVITLVLEILTNWPLIARNKVESSKIEQSVEACCEIPDEKVTNLAQGLLASWRALELGYRIPKAGPDASLDRQLALEHLLKRSRPDSPSLEAETGRRPAFVKPEASVVVRPQGPTLPVPPGWRVILPRDSLDRPWYENLETGKRQREMPVEGSKVTKGQAPPDVNVIIATAQAEKEEREREEAAREADQHERQRQEAATSMAHAKSKKVTTLFSNIVVHIMSKYKGHFNADQFKKRAKELTQILCEKEKRHPLYETERYDRLSADKESKVKAFAKDWIKKLVERNRSRQGRPSNPVRDPSSTGSASPHSFLATANAELIASTLVEPGHSEDPSTPSVEGRTTAERGSSPDTPPTQDPRKNPSAASMT